MRPDIQRLGDSFIYSCANTTAHTYEQFVPEHTLAYQMLGETQIFFQKSAMVLKKGQVLLAHRNQFAKSIKTPAEDEQYQCLSIVLRNETLRQFVLDNSIKSGANYKGQKNMLLSPNPFLTGYFESVLPYVESWEIAGKKLASMKVIEAVELLLLVRPELRSFLFDFSNPRKVDLEEFMVRNFRYNTSIENFAKLSGRSLSTFKRDFTATFHTSPSNWLKDKRLAEAYYRIKQKKHKAADIYLELGFESLSHFYTSFKQKYGKTPAQVQ